MVSSKDADFRGKQDSGGAWKAGRGGGSEEEPGDVVVSGIPEHGVECVPWAGGLRKIVGALNIEIKGSHSFFRGNANEKLEHGWWYAFAGQNRARSTAGLSNVL